MDNPFAYSIDRTSFQQPLRTHASEIDISSRRTMYEQAAPMQRRRPKYTRSKTGCLTCRRKKVKCDEAKPDCERCVNSGKTCTWPEPAVPRRTPLVADEAVYWPADEARPYTASSSAGLSDASSTPSSIPDSPRHAVIRHAYEEDRLAPLPFLSRRHSAPSLKSVENTVHTSPTRQAALQHPHVGTSVQSSSAAHASRQPPWNGAPNSYGAPMPPHMVPSSYLTTSSQPTATSVPSQPTGLSPIPELSSLPYSHFSHAHSDDAITAYPAHMHPALRYTLPEEAPLPDSTVPPYVSSGPTIVKQEHVKLVEFVIPPYHPRASYPDASTLSWDRYGQVQQNTAAAAYAEPPVYSHAYYADENPSPEPVWPTDPSYAHNYTQPYPESYNDMYQSTVDHSAHDHAPILHQPQPMQPAAIPYHH